MLCVLHSVVAGDHVDPGRQHGGNGGYATTRLDFAICELVVLDVIDVFDVIFAAVRIVVDRIGTLGGGGGAEFF